MDFYECGICGFYHPWKFSGDCRNDDKRFNLDEALNGDNIYTMEERMEADIA